MKEAILFSPRAKKVDPSIFLRAAFWNPNSGSAVNVRLIYEVLLDDGSIVNGSELIAVNASANQQLFTTKLTNGYLLWCAVFAVSSVLQSGEVYCQIALQGGDVASAEKRIPLISGYVSANNSLCFPDSVSEAMNDGPGASRTDSVADPAAGAALSYSFFTNALIQIQNLRFKFTTSATVANRTVYIEASDSTGESLHAASNLTQVASNIYRYFAAPNAQLYAAASNAALIVLPEQPRLMNATLSINVTGIQAGDQIAETVIRYKMWCNAA